MIPKIIHYCWLSGEEKPTQILECIESWKEKLPDYRIVCWDGQRFDVESVRWVSQAVKLRKWAFAADYIRLYAVYHQGGIYLDSDVKVFKGFDDLLEHRAFFATEVWGPGYRLPEPQKFEAVNPDPAIFGAEPHHPLVGKLMEYYRDRDFILPEGKIDSLPMPQILRSVTDPMGFVPDPSLHQVFEGDVHLYPVGEFLTYSEKDRPLEISENTRAVHLCLGSWLEPPVVPKRKTPFFKRWKNKIATWRKSLKGK